MSERQNQSFQLSFNLSSQVDIQGSGATSDVRMLLVREQYGQAKNKNPTAL
jgi:hypothetical protein